ncbi:CDP-alcohol phosphatidyltransferase family protein [Fulvivirga sediminis]|uniref:CDP-alcohol phosphatidyltransferase family protein n=1 Tax=Fulvivirga sediminis TaxID=2803949 RepID=A0A937K041_9BACT|nr:CDP-alcohol phosphatidyltransferase family protein [Fulvivirga sediminis]MBL3657983.1 CDP-alcohol phosphatidyltransferase family protein [Fulvivirga sediminis]
MNVYEYRTRGNSYLTPIIEKLIAKPITRLIGEKVNPNIISVAGHLAIYLALWLSFFKIFDSHYNLIAIAVLVTFQALCDKVDGVLARILEKSSPMGEFIDHFFELFNQGALLLIFYNLYTIHEPVILIILMVAIVLRNMVKYYEHYKTNMLVYSKVAFMEIKVVAVVILLLSLVPSIENFINFPGLAYSVIEIISVLLIGGNLVGILMNIRRIPQITYGMWLFIGLLVIVAVTNTLLNNSIAALFIILTYGGLYVGRLLSTQLVDGIERSPDFFLPLFLIIQYFLRFIDNTNALHLMVIYLCVNIILLTTKTFGALNKAKEEASK